MRLIVIPILMLAALTADPPPPAIYAVVGTGKAGYSGDGGPAMKAELHDPFDVALDRDGNLLFSDTLNHCIRRVDVRTNVITTVAGSGKKGYSGDGGPATQATMNEPYAVVVDPQDNLYIIDRLNSVVRRVDGKTGKIATVAGNGKKGSNGDGGPATGSMLRE